ncbi:hypothetical protein ASPCAL04799 [Aspergillus calidoustus]|uniref:Zn(2)-C6 fungal-type domain-containing protein n=2 Tax=Aspergillus calidoustus TaxID=454130 RepID=A0A0U5FVU2_ASPCI|nr:hypothetical protein ASPCAL04799 [Aspergillus calidoustus]
MPRPLELNRCQKCRSARVKCDGRRPRCGRCERGGRDCHWIKAASSTSPPHTPSQPSYRGTDYTSTQNPGIALQDPLAAKIFRHYMDKLAGWYDLNDSRRHFIDVVPVRARYNPLLLSAILAFAAAHQHRTLGEDEYLEIAEFYHYDSVRRLISLTRNVDELPIGESLAAICLLRSYEIITQNVSSQSHLQGCYSILANRHVHLTTDLLSAGFWNYLREDITASLIEHRSLMIDLSSQQISLDAGEEGQGDDADHANRVTFLLGKVINRCLAVDSPALTFEEWEVMKAELNNWKNSLPPSFEPIRTPGLRKGVAFPQIWTIRDWHVSSLHYYHTAMSILWLAEPQPEPLNSFQRASKMNSLRSRLDYHATEVCALAISSDSAAVWVNAFGPIAFCGPWLQDSAKRKEIKGDSEKWAKMTGWPVSTTPDALAGSPLGTDQ